jgi:ribose 5-phosphate isomerase B
VSIAANKVPGVRAALCEDAETARGARLWNNANVLCLSLRRISETIALEILQAWFNTAYKPTPEDDSCLAQVEQIERAYGPP